MALRGATGPWDYRTTRLRGCRHARLRDRLKFVLRRQKHYRRREIRAMACPLGCSFTSGARFGTARTAAASLATAPQCLESIKLHSTLCGDHSMDGLVHRPVPGLPAGWLRLLSIAGLSDPSITTYTSSTTVQGPISTVYEMASRIFRIPIPFLNHSSLPVFPSSRYVNTSPFPLTRITRPGLKE